MRSALGEYVLEYDFELHESVSYMNKLSSRTGVEVSTAVRAMPAFGKPSFPTLSQ